MIATTQWPKPSPKWDFIFDGRVWQSSSDAGIISIHPYEIQGFFEYSHIKLKPNLHEQYLKDGASREVVEFLLNQSGVSQEEGWVHMLETKQAEELTSVYFVRVGDFIKIGFASNPQSRILELSNGCPYEFKLLATITGDKTDERKLHRRFESLRHRGEWFRFESPLKEYIQSLP